ncbi:alpha/beta fold hydrolase [Pseudoroseomonas cervicalis]|uniref:alpha/beta fold hydrolase n=1 Tax=Teichococcus cervicalis TaxID=204525 RepID=UPI0027891DBF|nr:alpha/beta hydrolase [Pseudoroseomonas cervicalis]MDQ1079804.1 pimeloyl-ACP methyl ester carboxylesterase [Pseudoroseomonas cervicalis]
MTAETPTRPSPAGPPRQGALRVALPGGGVDLRWTEWGPPEGAPVICLHGLTRNGRDFDSLAGALAAEGRRVLCPDMPGRGQSSWLANGALYVVPTYVALMRPLLQGLGRPYDWVGTSMGGLIGLGLASLPGEGPRRLVLNDVGAEIPGTALAAIGEYLAEAPVFDDLAALEAHLRRIHAGFGPLSDAEWRHLARHSARMRADGRLALHHDPAIAQPMAAGGGDVALWPLWDRLDLPVLLLRGAESPLLTAATAARMAARHGVELVEFEGVGHAPALMDPAQINRVATFLRGG